MTPLGRDASQGSDERPKTRPKQALIRSDQHTGLDHLARQLHDDRSAKGERITANTLLRVAIDGLVEHGDRLHGDNEVQLLASWREFLSLAASLASVEAELIDAASHLDIARNGAGDPIAPSALIRIAVAGLARYRGVLHGANESELQESWLRFLDANEATFSR